MSKIIPLTRGKITIVDNEDFEWLNKWKWYYGSRCYAVRNEGKTPNRKTVLMHRQIMNPPDDMEVDHINGDTLDNRRSENLRICTTSNNQGNSRIRIDNKSGYKGVIWNKKWEAQIRKGHKNIHLGYYDKAEDAAHAYDKAAKEYFGEFANLNFPE